ncbi:MAG: GuaB3 family IMP dehydrogenase-related protein, partial [Chloroflexota bacterium]
CDLSWRLGHHSFGLPILAAAMDGVVDPAFASNFHQLGGLAVMNLEGLHGRYQDPAPVYRRIADASPEQAPALLQEIYAVPICDDLVRAAVGKAKAGGARLAVSVTPAGTERLAPIAIEAGADILVVQSTVTSARHVSATGWSLDLGSLCRNSPVPVIVGNTVSYDAAMALMEAGVSAILVGVGPGAECTSRQVLGIGLPQISATLEVTAARDVYWQATGRRVAVITDGGMQVSGDMVKALAAGADAIMLGAPLARALEAPGLGFNWGMASPHGSLPRGTRINVGAHAPLGQIVNGPSSVTNGTQNLAGAIRTAMAVLGATTIQDLHRVRMAHAPAITVEGKLYQRGGRV